VHPGLPAALTFKPGVTREVAMAEKNSAVLRRIWRKWYKPTLDDLFKEYESIDVLLTPEAAIEKMEELFKWVLDRSESADSSEPTSNPIGRPTFRFDEVAMTREAHHYAVDLFYNFPRKPGSQGKPRRGAPPLPMEYLDRILQLRRKGIKPFKIAEILGQPKDRMRKQIEIAERTWRQALEGIEQIKQRSSHLVAREPAAKLESKRKLGQSSKHQSAKRRAGK
jgi:hypothetical protein